MNIRLSGLMLVSLLSFFATPAIAADNSGQVNTKTSTESSLTIDEKFREHRRKRAELVQSIDETKAKLDTIRNTIASLDSDISRLTNDLTFIDPEDSDERYNSAKRYRDKQSAELKVLEDKIKSTSNPNEKVRLSLDLEKTQRNLENVNYDIERIEKASEQNKKRRDALQKDISERTKKLDDTKAEERDLISKLKEDVKSQAALEDEIGQLLTPESQRNTFKTMIASAFALLVAFVIFGFFAVAWRDEIVRRTIFSSDSGIQFLTLFSLVIAIILFGITGILESKELAAMLGGLSGYILGRANSRPHDTPRPQGKSSQTEPVPPPVQPQPV
ncbi:MAG: hypothetical protein ACK4GK_05900 [Ferrovibrio sp.]